MNRTAFAVAAHPDDVEFMMAVYHALPFGLRDPLRRRVQPDLYVDIGDVLDLKRRVLACHRSQRQWIDASQGAGNYLRTMEAMSATVGRMSGRFEFAEGWRRHLHLGLGPEDFDPLTAALGDRARTAEAGQGD